MVMRRYISHLFTWVISFLTLLAFSSCLNEHPKDQLGIRRQAWWRAQPFRQECRQQRLRQKRSS